MREIVEKALVRMDLSAESADLTGVLVMLEVAGRQVLLIRLGADGSIHRLGSGSLESVERDRFIGETDPELFRLVGERITPRLLDWCGESRSHPAPRGELCELVIAFKRADGRELMMAWEYGSLSKWPPPEILEFVDAAVEATRPWYEEQRKQVRLRAQRAEYAWWRSFTVPPT
jgi:hypothetical protein